LLFYNFLILGFGSILNDGCQLMLSIRYSVEPSSQTNYGCLYAHIRLLCGLEIHEC